MNKRLLTIVLLCCALCVLPAMTLAAASKGATGGAIEEAVSRGTLRVGLSSFVPWAMQDKSGTYIGFEVDVATRLAKDLGLKLELVPTRWSGIVPARLTGKFDVIIGGLSITPERSLRVNFSIPYDYSGIEAVGSRAAAQGRSSMDEFNTPQTIVAARTGSTAATAAKAVLPNAQVRLFDDEAPAVQEEPAAPAAEDAAAQEQLPQGDKQQQEAAP